MTQTIDQDLPLGNSVLGVRRARTDLELALADARIVAELAHRIEIWTDMTSAADAQDGVPEHRHDLSDRTVRELLSLVETLTRREAARLPARTAPTE